jgi:CRISPR/Cas system-associated exonuclease Cas4 (RecB family)
MPFEPRSLGELAEEWPKELDHISATSVKMIARCPEQWRRRYLGGEKTPPAAALIAGRADHAAIEKSMKQKVSSHVDLPTPEVVDEFYDVFEQEVGAVDLKEMEVKAGKELVTDRKSKIKVLDRMKVQGGDLVASYHGMVSPLIQPVAVEEEFTIIPPHLPVKVVGRIDLVADSGNSEGEGITNYRHYMIDRKRSGRARYVPEPEWIIQAEVYQLFRAIPHAWHITALNGNIIIPGPGQGESLLLPPKPREVSEQQLEHLAAEVGFLYMRYGPDNPWPTRGKLHPWACGYCGFRPTCWGWQ